MQMAADGSTDGTAALETRWQAWRDGRVRGGETLRHSRFGLSLGTLAGLLLNHSARQIVGTLVGQRSLSLNSCSTPRLVICLCYNLRLDSKNTIMWNDHTCQKPVPLLYAHTCACACVYAHTSFIRGSTGLKNSELQ